jgi:hypothetical protein
VLLSRLPLPLRGARLACVKPAASVRSEPGSNSQVWMRTLTRLITTFDEVRHSLHARTRTARRLHKNSVDLKRKTAEVSSGRFLLKAFRLRSTFAAKRPARTPPSTFLFLPIHLSNSPEPLRPHLPASRKAVEAPRFRCESGARSPNISEVLRRRDIAPRADDAPYDGYIVLCRVGCQHQSPESCRHPCPARFAPDRNGLAPRPGGRGRRGANLFLGKPRSGWAGNRSGKYPTGPDSCAGSGARRTAATFLRRSLRSGGRCQFGGICAGVSESVTRPASPEIG